MSSSSSALEFKVDLLHKKLNFMYPFLRDIRDSLPSPPSSIVDWWQITSTAHPLFQPVEKTLQYIKQEMTDPQQLHELLYNPCRGSLPTPKKKCQSTAHAPLIPFLLHQADFPLLLDGYTLECSREMYLEAVITVRTFWKTQRKKMFPRIALNRTGGAGATCHVADCQWFQTHYGGLENVSLSQVIDLILLRMPPPLLLPSDSPGTNSSTETEN